MGARPSQRTLDQFAGMADPLDEHDWQTLVALGERVHGRIEQMTEDRETGEHQCRLDDLVFVALADAERYRWRCPACGAEHVNHVAPAIEVERDVHWYEPPDGEDIDPVG